MVKYLLIAVCCVVLIGGALWFFARQGVQPVRPLEDTPPLPTKARVRIPPEKVIDYGKIKDEHDKALTELMNERKASYGVEKSLDMIVKPDESIKVGDQTVRMKKILDEVRLVQGEILETDLETGTQKPSHHDYGIYVVEQADNIWDIHFRLLTEYYGHKGIQLSPVADEPDAHGRSSGVGKILKFSEHMVHIYNMKEHKLETRLDRIFPLTKVLVYNMSSIFALLDRIDYQDVYRIEFDGETLWMPAEP